MTDEIIDEESRNLNNTGKKEKYRMPGAFKRVSQSARRESKNWFLNMNCFVKSWIFTILTLLPTGLTYLICAPKNQACAQTLHSLTDFYIEVYIEWCVCTQAKKPRYYKSGNAMEIMYYWKECISFCYMNEYHQFHSPSKSLLHVWIHL